MSETVSANGQNGHKADDILVAGKTYTVLYREDLSQGAWLILKNVSAQAATGPIDVTDSGAGASGTRFYRVATP